MPVPWDEFPGGKYLDFHHGTPEAVTPPRCASGHSEPRSPCPSIPINVNLTGAPPAVLPAGGEAAPDPRGSQCGVAEECLG